jgi:GNAT superfamily N-acetyltransferase
MDRFVVVEAGNSQDKKRRIVGFGQLRPLSKEDLELASIYVAPDYRRRGIASAIVSYLLEREKSRRIHHAETFKRRIFCLTVGSESLYLRHGFDFYPLKNNFIWDKGIPCTLRFELVAGQVVARILKPEAPLVLLYTKLDNSQSN